ncbi:MAG: hypothetical protein KGS72_27680 [Cyanobacteria bacterium REEB67]|nr:hypothetical protein [Cyanobacteria bacterium REEB67]
MFNDLERANQLLNLRRKLVIPLVSGGPPFNDQRTVIGAVGFKVTSLKWPQQITGTIINPIYISGQPGYQSQISSSGQDNLFLAQTNPWQVMLLQ